MALHLIKHSLTGTSDRLKTAYIASRTYEVAAHTELATVTASTPAFPITRCGPGTKSAL